MELSHCSYFCQKTLKSKIITEICDQYMFNIIMFSLTGYLYPLKSFFFKGMLGDYRIKKQ